MSSEQKIAAIWLGVSAVQNVLGVVGMCFGYWVFGIIVMAFGFFAFLLANSVYSLGDMANDFISDMNGRERENRNRQERLNDIHRLINSINSDPTPSQAPTESPAPTPAPTPSSEEREAEQHIHEIFRL